jgi:hypothetical protein
MTLLDNSSVPKSINTSSILFRLESLILAQD